jgi:hypothetical protein
MKLDAYLTSERLRSEALGLLAVTSFVWLFWKEGSYNLFCSSSFFEECRLLGCGALCMF